MTLHREGVICKLVESRVCEIRVDSEHGCTVSLTLTGNEARSGSADGVEQQSEIFFWSSYVPLLSHDGRGCIRWNSRQSSDIKHKAGCSDAGAAGCYNRIVTMEDGETLATYCRRMAEVHTPGKKSYLKKA